MFILDQSGVLGAGWITLITIGSILLFLLWCYCVYKTIRYSWKHVFSMVVVLLLLFFLPPIGIVVSLFVVQKKP